MLLGRSPANCPRSRTRTGTGSLIKSKSHTSYRHISLASAAFGQLLMFEATDKSSSANQAPSGSPSNFHLDGKYARILGPENLKFDLLTLFLMTQLQMLSLFPPHYWGNC